jgi:broad specificity phosphatase PhoE
MPPLLYVVRHGETDWNAQCRLQGQADTDLNAAGVGQASENGRRLAGLIPDPARFDFVASPMLRTRRTMELARAAMGLDPLAYRTDPRLVEINFGDWQGFTLPELESRYPGAARERQAVKWDFVPPGEGAESYEMLFERVRPFFESLADDTVCVTHGGVIRALFRLVGGLSKEDASALEIPQDRVLRVNGGKLEWL